MTQQTSYLPAYQPSILAQLSSGDFRVNQYKEIKGSRNTHELVAKSFIAQVNADLTNRAQKDEGLKDLNVPELQIKLAQVQNVFIQKLGSRENPKGPAFLNSKFDSIRGRIHQLQEDKDRGTYSAVTRRIVRYALYQMHLNGYFAAAGAFSFPTLRDIAGGIFAGAGAAATGAAAGVGTVLGGAASGAAAAAGTAAKGASIVLPNLMQYIPGILAFLAITEGPGVIGHMVRKASPESAKRVYRNVTPNIIQKPVNFVFHTEKPVAKFLDQAIRAISIMAS